MARVNMSKSKILFIALSISIAVNLGIAGFIGSQWYRLSEIFPQQEGLTFDRQAAMATVGEAQRNQIHQIWMSYHPQLRQGLRNFREAKRKLAILLSAETVDSAAIKAAYAEMSTYRNDVEDKLYTVLLKTAETLPAKKRQEFFSNGFKKSRHHMQNMNMRQNMNMGTPSMPGMGNRSPMNGMNNIDDN